MNEPPWRSAAWKQHLNHAVIAGRRMHYLDVGEGPVVVLVHGLAAAWSVWFRNIPALAREHRVIAVDLPGFGRSESLGPGVEVGDYVQALSRLLDELEIGRVRMVGHSLGGIVVQQFAARHPARTAAVVLVATGGPPTRAQAFALRSLAAGIGLSNRVPRPAIAAAARAVMAAPPVRRLLLSALVHDPAVVSRRLATDMVSAACRSVGATSALEAGLRAVEQENDRPITCPSLVVAGDRDRLVPAASLHYVSASLSGARQHVLANAGHHPMFEQATAFNALLQRFLWDVDSVDRIGRQ